MAVVEVTKKNFEEEVLKSDRPVLIDFNADWCGPCQMLKPTVEEIAEEQDAVKIASINVDDEPELAMQYGVSSIPCLVLVKNGEEANRSVGFVPKEALLQLLEG